MPRFISHSFRRLVAALALATTLALPALAIIGGQAPAGATGGGHSTTTVVTVAPNSVKWHSVKWH
jgi:hypothetical protein